MSETATPPRRWKLPSEFDAADRVAAKRFGARGRVERDEYKQWRQRVLADEHDDLALRQRALEEEAEVLRDRAAARVMDAREQMTVEGWVARQAEEGAARETGREPEPVADGGAAGLEADAAELESEAQEIAQHLAETRDAA